MRITYRNEKNTEYWKRRWDNIEVDEPAFEINNYPLRYANLIVKNPNQNILEAGCGAGRLLRFFHNKGYKITGIEFFEDIIEKLKKKDNSLNVKVENILNLNFKDDFFDCVLAFGLYHNFESENLDRAISETYRVMKKGAKICASFRADNIQELIVDFIRKDKKQENKCFHKLNLKKREFVSLFEKHNFKVEDIYSVQNMPFLYKFKFFRAKDQKKFNENIARVKGYKLSFFGNLIQNILIKYLPDQFCNVYVLIAYKN